MAKRQSRRGDDSGDPKKVTPTISSSSIADPPGEWKSMFFFFNLWFTYIWFLSIYNVYIYIMVSPIYGSPKFTYLPTVCLRFTYGLPMEQW